MEQTQQHPEVSLELSYKEDSLTSHPAKLIASAIGCDVNDSGKDIIPPIDCSSLREVRVDIDGNGRVDILASPTTQGNYFYPVGRSGETYRICASRIKVVASQVQGDVHLVGRG